MSESVVVGVEKKAYIFFNRENVEVTKTYLDIIKKALEMEGYVCEYTTSLKNISTKNLIIFAVGVDAYKYYWRGYKNFIIWQQGVSAEESYIRNKSDVRVRVLNYIDCFVLKRAKIILFVSNYLKKHYEILAHADFSKKSYIMPCFNEELDASMFNEKDYSLKNFAYVGSLDVWQCFEETVQLYAKIEQAIPNTFLKVLTFSVEEAERILKHNNIKNYIVKCVPKQEVKQELQDVTYGFILRHDIEVNRVATPTKISSYLSAGVLPIYSACLKDFNGLATGKNFAIPNNEGQEEFLINRIKLGVERDEIIDEIISVFDTYYSVEKHTKGIAEKIKEVKI